MRIRDLNRLKGKKIRDVYLFLEEKIIKQIREKKFNKEIKVDGYEKSEIHFLDVKDEAITSIDIHIADLYLKHKFDLLGSGLQSVSEKKTLKKDEIQQVNCFNISTIMGEIIQLNPFYKLLEWQWDFKNNYLFSVMQRSNRLVINESSGYDIKVPWELARCQHLPFLARLYRISKDNRYKNEVLCEILDFIANNPVGYGVNWKCTMDVAIRVSNWIMALDLIHWNDKNSITDIISKSIYQHCIFIRYNLEDQRGYRGNHYLADIVGLLYSSTFFKPIDNIRKIQEFSIEQLFLSIDEQFYDDGGNFESSLPYHRLSIELVVYGLWRLLIVAENNNLLHQYCKKIEKYSRQIQKVGKALGVMIDSIKPNGNIYQLGDNDSGHLFRFYRFGSMCSRKFYANKYNRRVNVSVWDENELNCDEIKDVINAVLGLKTNSCFFDGLVRNIFCTNGISQLLLETFRETQKPTYKRSDRNNEMTLSYKTRKIIELHKNVILDDAQPFYYPNFGLVGLKNSTLYLGVSLTDVGQNGRGGHTHNDKLSYELFFDGIDYQSDPGTYVYTVSRDWRNMFRSALAHNSPYFGQEQNLIGDNCFELKQRTECKLIELTDRVIRVSCKYDDIYVIRKFELDEGKITITDYSNVAFVNRPNFGYFSNGYGKIIKQKENRKND